LALLTANFAVAGTIKFSDSIIIKKYMGRRCKGDQPMTNKEKCQNRRDKLAPDQEKLAKARDSDAARKRRARAAAKESSGKSNEVRRLER